jgi:hypothetical protein
MTSFLLIAAPSEPPAEMPSEGKNRDSFALVLMFAFRYGTGFSLVININQSLRTGPPLTPSEPTLRPTAADPSSSPDIQQDVVQLLTPYILDYSVTDERIPFRSEYLEVVELTRVYLEGFFVERYQDSTTEILIEFLTLFTGSEFDFGQPIVIFYTSSAIFDPLSSSIPSVDDLDAELASAFAGENLNGYVSMLQALPTSNVFSTTESVEFEVGDMTASSSSSGPTEPSESIERDVTTAAAALAGLSGLLVIAAGVLLVRRRNQEEEYDENASLTGKPPGTVAGETYATATGWSEDDMSVPHQGSFDS